MKKNIILSLITVFLLLFLLVVFVNDKRNLTVIESISKDSLIFVNKIVNIPFNFITEKINEIKIINIIFNFNFIYFFSNKIK